LDEEDELCFGRSRPHRMRIDVVRLQLFSGEDHGLARREASPIGSTRIRASCRSHRRVGEIGARQEIQQSAEPARKRCAPDEAKNAANDLGWLVECFRAGDAEPYG